MPFIRTCLGDIPAEAAGHTQTHEHVLSDMSGIVTNDSVAGAGAVGIDEPVRPDTYDWIRRHVLNRDNLRLDSEAQAIAELGRYRDAGGVTIVDSTSIGLGRDAQGLARIARAVGINIVMGSGYYVRALHPVGLDQKSVEELRDEIVRDVTSGVDGTGIRAGIIGEIGLSWPVHEVESRVLQAAVAAQVLTGAALQIHPGRDRQAPLAAMRTIVEHGGLAERTIMSHIDRTLMNLENILELARTGCYLSFDLFGQESSYYAFNPAFDRPNDATRVDHLIALIGAGYGDRLLVSQDICQKVYLRGLGGPGYTHVLDNVVPTMRRKGMTEDEVRTVTVGNPAAILAFA